jgi:hypothetical protein
MGGFVLNFNGVGMITFIEVNARPESLGLQNCCPFWSPAGTIFRSLHFKKSI